MKKISILTFTVAFMSCQNTKTLEDSVKERLAHDKGTFAIAFKDLQSGETMLINDREVFHAASTMKTPVMIEVFKQSAAGKFSLTDSAVVKNQFKSIVDGSEYSLDPVDDSETGLYAEIGKKKTISSLVYEMIIMSSNLATNMIIEMVDAKMVTETMRQLGAKDIQVLRGVEDSKAFEKKLNNTTTAYDMMLIFEKLATGELVSPDASQAMINILLDQRFNEIIPARLPDNVKVAHKTGNITGVRHDAGVVYLPDGRKYVLVMLSKNLADEETSINRMAEVSEMIYEYVNGK
jgi:beta-lactamase class A